MMLFESQEMSLEFNCSLPRRNPERAGSIHHTPLPIPSMHSLTSFPSSLQSRGDLGLWTWLLASLPEIPATRVPWGMSRTAERSILLMLFALKRASMERRMLTDLFTPQQMS